MKLKSKYKNLVVSGCSFTSNWPSKPNEPWNWPNMLADWTGMTIHNLGIPGAGNSHISKSLRIFLTKTQLDPEDTLVIAMWSGIGRIDFITDPKSSLFEDNYPFPYYYDKSAELSLGGNWWTIGSNATPVQKLIIDYSKFQNDETFAISSWLEMTALTDFLNRAKYKHYFTSFCNYKLVDEIKGDACIVDYYQQLKKLNLSLDQDNWLKLNEIDYYGNWARRQNLIDPSDDFHPFYNASERWPREILIPNLIEEGVLYYE